jgi:hypothetical protein
MTFVPDPTLHRQAPQLPVRDGEPRYEDGHELTAELSHVSDAIGIPERHVRTRTRLPLCSWSLRDQVGTRTEAAEAQCLSFRSCIRHRDRREQKTSAA